MKSLMTGALVLSLSLAGLAGCGLLGSSEGQKAIEESQTLQTSEQKTEYLVAKAKEFYDSKQFKEAIQVGQHILRYLDKNSAEIQALLAQATKELMASGKQAMEDVSQRFGNLESASN